MVRVGYPSRRPLVAAANDVPGSGLIDGPSPAEGEHRGAHGVDAVFAALADPTRRGVLSRLSAGGPLTATQLARDVPVSRQAVVKHLSLLADAGLVTGVRQGREVRFEVEAGTLAGAQAWLAQVGDQWDSRLRALGEHLQPGPLT